MRAAVWIVPTLVTAVGDVMNWSGRSCGRQSSQLEHGRYLKPSSLSRYYVFALLYLLSSLSGCELSPCLRILLRLCNSSSPSSVSVVLWCSSWNSPFCVISASLLAHVFRVISYKSSPKKTTTLIILLAQDIIQLRVTSSPPSKRQYLTYAGCVTIFYGRPLRHTLHLD